MVSVIIRKKDLDRLGKELLSEMFDNLHDEYVLKEFENMNDTKLLFLSKICINHIYTLHRNNQITDEEKIELIKPFSSKIFLTDEHKPVFLDSNIHDDKLVDEAMKKGNIDTRGIYDTIKFLKIPREAFEDLYYKTKAFKNIFEVFEGDYTYLED